MPWLIRSWAPQSDHGSIVNSDKCPFCGLSLLNLGPDHGSAAPAVTMTTAQALDAADRSWHRALGGTGEAGRALAAEVRRLWAALEIHHGRRT